MPALVQVQSLRAKDDTKYVAVVSDGAIDQDAMLSSQVSQQVKAGKLGVGSILKVSRRAFAARQQAPALLAVTCPS